MGIAMIQITMLIVAMMVETAVDKMLTLSGAQNVYVWRMVPQHHLPQQ